MVGVRRFNSVKGQQWSIESAATRTICSGEPSRKTMPTRCPKAGKEAREASGIAMQN